LDIEDRRKGLLMWLVRKNCDDNFLSAVIHESIMNCNDGFHHTKDDAFYNQEVGLRNIARKSFEIHRKNFV
jgi:hypothetical protein